MLCQYPVPFLEMLHAVTLSKYTGFICVKTMLKQHEATYVPSFACHVSCVSFLFCVSFYGAVHGDGRAGHVPPRAAPGEPTRIVPIRLFDAHTAFKERRRSPSAHRSGDVSSAAPQVFGESCK